MTDSTYSLAFFNLHKHFLLLLIGRLDYRLNFEYSTLKKTSACILELPFPSVVVPAQRNLEETVDVSGQKKKSGGF